jgi:hypothetical protein
MSNAHNEAIQSYAESWLGDSTVKIVFSTKGEHKEREAIGFLYDGKRYLRFRLTAKLHTSFYLYETGRYILWGLIRYNKVKATDKNWEVSSGPLQVFIDNELKRPSPANQDLQKTHQKLHKVFKKATVINESTTDTERF